jgi:hypothetical protein
MPIDTAFVRAPAGTTSDAFPREIVPPLGPMLCVVLPRGVMVRVPPSVFTVLELPSAASVPASEGLDGVSEPIASGLSNVPSSDPSGTPASGWSKVSGSPPDPLDSTQPSHAHPMAANVAA